MSTTTRDDTRLIVEANRRQRPWRSRHAFDPKRPTLPGLIGRYVLLLLVAALSLGPFLWQLSTSLKSLAEDVYSFPPHLIPQHPTLDAYLRVARVVPIWRYAWHSVIVAAVCVIGNVVLSTMAGYALSCMRFRGKRIVMAILLSVLLLPGEVTLTSQYLIIRGMGLANTLMGVAIPGVVGAINVLLMATACRSIPMSVLDAATVDGANTWDKIRHVVWPNVRGMASVVAVFSFIGAWDDFLWPLVVLNDPDKYTLTVGMQYLNSTMSTDPREVAAGTMIALIPIIIVFASMQKVFFRGVESGGVKG
ncbi:carbohydrate ABC transporter permease [Acidipropionibacterium timonense]|uniref:carbohydrate ABC transporter permease n=1 Tax=Acidipropionibacterium timonense TaxID=2161818 RepID=UPI001030EB47|nr:carbohydrate ABC transporter permease [Acidipropionibacterium timonense]